MRLGSRNPRRGLSTVVTNMIILVAVAMLGSGVVVWGNSGIFANERTLSTSISTNVNQIAENLVIEKVWFSKNQYVNITLNNQGSIGLNVTKIELQFMNASKTVKVIFPNLTVFPNALNSTNKTVGYNKIPTLTNVVITTARGATFSTSVVTP